MENEKTNAEGEKAYVAENEEGREVGPTMEEIKIYPSKSIFERQEDVPEYDFMRGLLYDAEKWKREDRSEFERRLLHVVKDYLEEYMAKNNL